jgi:hypothetical protein
MWQILNVSMTRFIMPAGNKSPTSFFVIELRRQDMKTIVFTPVAVLLSAILRHI